MIDVPIGRILEFFVTKIVRVRQFLLLFLLLPSICIGQYQFKGSVTDRFKNKPISLSLITDLNKTERVYLDQIIQQTTTDSLGNFVFSGNQLPKYNSLLRLHIDTCNDTVGNRHFMQACEDTKSILFLAKNKDSLHFPMSDFGEAFCSIEGTNPLAQYFLDFEALKNEFIHDFTGKETSAEKQLKFKRWFTQFHEFARAQNEPLLDAYILFYLGNPTAETYDAYKSFLKEHQTNKPLFKTANTNTLDSNFNTQIDQKLASLGLVATDTYTTLNVFWFVLSIVGGLVVVFILYRITKRTSTKTNLKAILTPQEYKIAMAIAAQKTNKEIATELFISLSTVKTHINNIYKKLGVTDRAMLRKYVSD